MQTTVVYTKFENQNMAAIYDKWLPVLPSELKAKNLRFHNLDDRVRNLLGKFLLLKALELFGYTNITLDNLYYNEFGRPHLSLDFDFNITHSGSYVFCAIGPDSVGIDIEEMLPIDFSFAKEMMSDGEWQLINNAKSPLQEYYKHWATKEAIMKADGRGFSIQPDKISIKNNQAQIENIIWHTQELCFDPNYYGCIATRNFQSQVNMIYIDVIQSHN